MLLSLFAAALLSTSALAHSNMLEPAPRKNQDSAFMDINQNGCENENTDIPPKNNFQRGQKIPLQWWWNNHSGGFIKMALIEKVTGFVGPEGKAALLANENIIQGQCYTRKCDRSGFDPGQTKKCEGADLEIPDWVSDGEYTLQWSHFGGYDSDGVPTRQLPIYHTCANIRINGGAPPQKRPSDWIAPFFGGDEIQIKGKSAGADQCAFKKFAKEPENPSVVNTKDDDPGSIQFGRPDGWAAPGNTNKKRAAAVYLPRLGRIARNVRPQVHDDDINHH